MYAGTIRHRRHTPRPHAFRYRLALAWREVEGAEAIALAGPADAVFALSHPFGFNPVAFFYGYRGGELAWIVARVTNTPWREQHAYVLGPHGGSMQKTFHVSPFMGMDHEYTVRATAPAETLSMHIESRRGGELAFDATLNLRRRPVRRSALAVSALRTLPLIYAHGLRLALKGVPHHPHPRTEAP
jgi:DUF1365 family protein